MRVVPFQYVIEDVIGYPTVYGSWQAGVWFIWGSGSCMEVLSGTVLSRFLSKVTSGSCKGTSSGAHTASFSVIGTALDRHLHVHC